VITDGCTDNIIGRELIGLADLSAFLFIIVKATGAERLALEAEIITLSRCSVTDNESLHTGEAFETSAVKHKSPARA
jgi:hypothetical protein